ncbi:hypothetical protein [Phaeospirillum tilakii]|uniref:Transposase n=1 Tax=Phaeospirillum tilakii TaxID=741673 RepID=A0ABW5C7S3_9PROT
MNQPGLDGRRRNNDGTIRKKNGRTLVGNVRETYGADFAAGRRSDMMLSTLLKEEGVDSLSQLLKKPR